ncbi:MAG: VOC family protein [Pseudomonadota bacterium]
MPLGPASPFFIVADIARATDFYTAKLGFDLRHKADVFAIVGRGSAQIMLKEINPETPPHPNHTRHPWARWDAFIYTPDPDAFAAEINTSAQDTEDGLRGFELADADGYVLFFGRPIPEAP